MMSSLRISWKMILHALAVMLLAMLTVSITSAQPLTIVNSDFSAVSIQCSSGYAYESYMGGNCESRGPQQDFNSEVGAREAVH